MTRKREAKRAKTQKATAAAHTPTREPKATPRLPLLGEHPVPQAKAGSPKPATPVAKPSKAPRRTMVGAAVEMIKAGKSNDEVRVMLVRDFALPGAHGFYASWYRSYAVKKGIVTREFAREHATEAAPRPPAAPAAPRRAAGPKKPASKNPTK